MEWIEITEDSIMPKNKERVLVIEAPLYGGGKQTVEFARYQFDADQDEGQQHMFFINGRTARVTHWMPMPDLGKC